VTGITQFLNCIIPSTFQKDTDERILLLVVLWRSERCLILRDQHKLAYKCSETEPSGEYLALCRVEWPSLKIIHREEPCNLYTTKVLLKNREGYEYDFRSCPMDGLCTTVPSTLLYVCYEYCFGKYV
jgi:hypothetical protein